MGSGYFIGIFEGHADPAAAIVRNGEVIAFAEEERFTRQKHAWGVYPIRSLKYCLDAAGITLSDVEAVALNWDIDAFTNGRMGEFFDSVNSEFPVDAATRGWQSSMIRRFHREETERRHHFEWRRAFGDVAFPPIVSAPHHYVHAFQSAMHSGLERSLCLTFDGSGDQHCTVLWDHNGTSLTPIYERKIPHSLGWYYAAFTEYLGFQAYDGEYKLMGLAAYGKEDDELMAKVGKVLFADPDQPHSYALDPGFIHYGPHSYSHRFTDRLVELFERPPRISTDEYEPWHENLAFAVQHNLEQRVLALIEWGIEKTGVDRVTIGGGVGHNVKLNSRIFEHPAVSGVWANPLCSDGGAALGAAHAAEFNATGTRPAKLRRLDLGYEEDDVESILKSSRVEFRRSHNIARETAELIAKGNVVAWFQGRMEAGPRALGQRSILADPRDVRARDRVNSIIKFREYWRPFCPSILAEMASDYFDHITEASFMVIAFAANERLKREAPAIVHVDGTARVQIVEKDVLPLYHSLISEFKAITGVGALLNTSFNIKGEPVVCTARDALRTFWATGLDALAIGDLIVEKPAIQ